MFCFGPRCAGASAAIRPGRLALRSAAALRARSRSARCCTKTLTASSRTCSLVTCRVCARSCGNAFMLCLCVCVCVAMLCVCACVSAYLFVSLCMPVFVWRRVRDLSRDRLFSCRGVWHSRPTTRNEAVGESGKQGMIRHGKCYFWAWFSARLCALRPCAIATTLTLIGFRPRESKCVFVCFCASACVCVCVSAYLRLLLFVCLCLRIRACARARKRLPLHTALRAHTCMQGLVDRLWFLLSAFLSMRV